MCSMWSLIFKGWQKYAFFSRLHTARTKLSHSFYVFKFLTVKVFPISVFPCFKAIQSYAPFESKKRPTPKWKSRFLLHTDQCEVACTLKCKNSHSESLRSARVFSVSEGNISYSCDSNRMETTPNFTSKLAWVTTSEVVRSKETHWIKQNKATTRSWTGLKCSHIISCLVITPQVYSLEIKAEAHRQQSSVIVIIITTTVFL